MTEMYPPTPPENPGTPLQPNPGPVGAAPWAGPPRVQSTRTLATAALVAAGFVLLLSLALTITAFDAARRLEAAELAGESAFDTFTVHDVLGLPFVAAQLLAWVLTAVWLGQARRNVSNIRPGYHFQRSTVWDWLAWIVPIVNLWFPHQIVRDLSKGSSRAFAQHTWLGLWWGTWLAGLFAGQAADRISLGSASSVGPGALPILNGLTTVAWAVAFGLWVKIVLSIVRDQESAAASPR